MSHSAYQTLAHFGECSFVTQKSEFIGGVMPCATEKDALAFITKRKKQYADARHNVFAYTLHNNRLQRCSDDGEPQGTAGYPILDFLVQEQLWDLCVVVTRYFGGILLGTGGLVRAYTHAAKIAVETQEICTMHWCVQCLLCLDYAFYGTITHLLAQKNVLIADIDFGEQISLQLQVPQSEVGVLEREIQDCSGGLLSLQTIGEGYVPLTAPR